jgi:hypothetical protein
MRKRPALTDERAAEVGLSADRFQNALKTQKEGVKFVFTFSQADLKRLGLQKKVLIELLNKTCYLPTPDPLTVVKKILDVKFTLDLREGQPTLPPIVTMQFPDFDPAPANRTELQNGPPGGFRTDYILFQSLRVHRVWNNGPFGVAFRANLFDFYQKMLNAIADESVGRAGVQWPQFQTELADSDVQDLFLTANLPEEGAELPLKVGQLTQNLEAAQGEMSAACFYCADEQLVRNGLVDFEMPHPVTQKLTWFTAMCCGHLLAAHAVTNWKHYNLQIAPLSDGAKQTFTYVMEKSLADQLITDLKVEMPRKSFAVPSNGLTFGVSRHPFPPNEQDMWRSRTRIEPADADLNKEFVVKAEVEIVYALLPETAPSKLSIGLFSAAPYLANFSNIEEMSKRLEKAAESAIQAEMLAEFSFSNLHIGSPPPSSSGEEMQE